MGIFATILTVYKTTNGNSFVEFDGPLQLNLTLRQFNL